MRITDLMPSSRGRIVIGLAFGALVVALVVLVLAYRRVSTANDSMSADRTALCRSRASLLKTLADDKPQLDMRHQVKKVTDPFVSQICLGERMPVPIDEANDCWVKTQADSCYFGYVEKLLPLYQARGWRP